MPRTQRRSTRPPRIRLDRIAYAMSESVSIASNTPAANAAARSPVAPINSHRVLWGRLTTALSGVR